jgi:signal transduction histidine kinase/DNA-binding response OmpR family regulator
MDTARERTSARQAIARRVLVIQKEQARHNVFQQLHSSNPDLGWEFIFADRLETAPADWAEGQAYLHCIDAEYREDEIKAYVARLKAVDAAHTVLAFCDKSDRSRTRSLRRLGVYDFVTKPFDPEELAHALERSHERARLSRENSLREEETAGLEAVIASVIASTKRIAGHLSLEDFCRALMEELSMIFGAAGGSFYLVEGDRLVRVFALDPGHAPDAIELPLAEESYLGFAHKTGRPVLASDMVREEHAVPSGYSGYKDADCLILPVFHHGEELVAFISLHDRGSDGFSHRDKTFGAVLASVNSGYLRALRTLADLREQESRYGHFFQEGLTLNFIARPDGRMLLANPAFLRLFGFAGAAEPSVTPLFGKKNGWATIIRRLQTEIKIEQIEIETASSDGVRRVLFGTLLASTDDRHELVSVSAVFFDMTQVKLQTEELNHSLKMEAIGRLAGGVAHDYNNLITAILGYCEVLKDRVTDREMGEEIEGIRGAGEKAIDLTRRLLSLTRTLPLEPEAIDLGRLMGKIESNLKRVLGEDIELISQYPAAGALVRADCGELEQVIMNLVVNARDAMPEGGRITMAIAAEDSRAATNRTTDDAPGRLVVLKVSDEGIGMDEETQRHIFEPFFSTKGKGKGAGLGLSLVYGIVRQAGGTVSVESASGHGSTFTLAFPRALESEPQSAAGPVVAETAASGEGILVVDDESVVRSIVCRVLKKHGYTVSEAADGAQALELARRAERPFACAIIDMIMPGMGGVALAAALKALMPGLKVLHVSGYAPDDVESQGGGAADLITKPFHQEELAHRVRELLDRKE